MTQYLLSVYQPVGTPPPDEVLAPIMAGLEALEDKMRAEGAWVFTGRLHPTSTATVVQAKDGDILTTDGPFTEGKEHLGGFTIVRADDLDGALSWAREMTNICGLAIEVRPFVPDET